jgi:hypothetical protein
MRAVILALQAQSSGTLTFWNFVEIYPSAADRAPYLRRAVRVSQYPFTITSSLDFVLWPICYIRTPERVLIAC